MDLIVQELGPEASVKVVIEKGKVMLVAGMDTKGLDVAVSMGVDSDYFLDKLAEAVPGSVDDAVIQVLKAALKAL